MRPIPTILGRAATAVAPGLILLSLAAVPTRGDEPGRFGRLFGLGGSRPADSSASSMAGPKGSNSGSGSGFGSGSASLPRSAVIADPSGFAAPALTTPTGPASPPPPRLAPRARNLKPPTEADPLVSRISLGRSDTGGQFGMFLQVYADGTIIDGEGVHRVSPEALKPVLDVIESGELGKLKGYCGNSAGDFIETVHVVAYERSYGRLKANSFSFAGNPQGCDHAVHRLQTALDALQAKIVPNGAAPSVAQADLAPPAPLAPAPGAGPAGLPTPPLPLTSTP